MFAVVFKRALNIQAIISQLSFSQTPTKSFDYRQNNGSIFFFEVTYYYIRKWLSPYFFTLCEKYPYSELFWSAFSRMRTEYREIRRSISLYSVRMWQNVDQNNSEYGHFLLSASVGFWYIKNHKVSDVFRGYENVTLDEEELNYQVKTDNTSISVFVKLSWKGKDRKQWPILKNTFLPDM